MDLLCQGLHSLRPEELTRRPEVHQVHRHTSPRSPPHQRRAYLRSRFHFIMLQYPKSKVPMPTANML